MNDVCPSCGRREIDTPSGFCAACVVDRAAANYSEADRKRIEARTRLWGSGATRRVDAHLATLRQQRSRQVAVLRPRRPSLVLDPWELAIEALGKLKRLAQSFAAGRSEIEDVSETIRRLAWGPDDGEVWFPRQRPRRRQQIPGQLALWAEAVEEVAA